MKKMIAILIAVLIAVALLASCGSSASREPMTNSSPSGAPMPSSSPGSLFPDPAPSADYSYESKSYLTDQSVSNAAGFEGESGSGVTTVVTPVTDTKLADKIIYTVSADIETVAFDETIVKVNDMLTANGGFIESSYVGGRNSEQAYYGLQTFRSANFTLRIPKERLNAVTSSLDTLGNVVSLRSDAENITSQFYDTESRLNSYKTQETRLLDMLAKADNVKDMIDIESRLGDIRYQIESLTSTLRNWQNSVDYSTLNIFIREVAKLTAITPVQPRSYWQQIGDGITASTVNVGNFFTTVFSWFIINLPVLIILAIVAIAIIFIVRWALRREKRMMERYEKNRQSRSAGQNPQYQPNQPDQQAKLEKQEKQDTPPGM